jgi:hypothetical protein
VFGSAPLCADCRRRRLPIGALPGTRCARGDSRNQLCHLDSALLWPGVGHVGTSARAAANTEAAARSDGRVSSAPGARSAGPRLLGMPGACGSLIASLLAAPSKPRREAMWCLPTGTRERTGVFTGATCRHRQQATAVANHGPAGLSSEEVSMSSSSTSLLPDVGTELREVMPCSGIRACITSRPGTGR